MAAAATTPRNLLEMHILRPHPGLSESEIWGVMLVGTALCEPVLQIRFKNSQDSGNPESKNPFKALQCL